MKEPETNFPLHLFHHGTNFKAYETMGAHAVTKTESADIFFAYGLRTQKAFRL